MEYSEYIANYQAQQERQAQLVAKYSDRPEPKRNKALWAVNSVERHEYTDVMQFVRLAVCLGLMVVIFLLWCALS